MSREFDIVGPYSRSLSDLHRLVEHTLDVDATWPRFPTTILYPLDFFPHSNAKHQAMVDEFVGVLERFLGVHRVPISLAGAWDRNPPAEAAGKSLQEYLAKVPPLISEARHR